VALKIYNTLTQKKEDFQTITPNVVTMYVCGVTVYDSSHIGHAMSAIVFDVVRRYLEFKGYDVRHVVNFTDIDDKIINRSLETGEDWQAITQRYVDQYFRMLESVNVQKATIYPRATQEIDGIIALIQLLIDKGFAYAVEGGDVYFRVSKKEHYGELKHQNLDELQAGNRIEIDPRKEHPMDFALWKGVKPSEPSWVSPWGEGRPGWHIECSQMAREHLGDQIDIHGGGSDLIFPHHENEIAQTESASGLRPFVRYWMHNGMLSLQIRNEQGEIEYTKMSKSLGNIITVDQLLSQGDHDILRMIVIQSLYRNRLIYGQELFEAAKRGLQTLKSVFEPTENWGEADDLNGEEMVSNALLEASDRARQDFLTAMDDDFNTPQAVARLFDLKRDIFKARDSHASPQSLHVARRTLAELGSVLGLRLESFTQSQQVVEAKPFIDLLLQVRKDLRTAKQWALADTIRKGLGDLGLVIEDKPDGSTVWKLQ
jgi:cysteinyl-tRNA synthetase